MYEQFFACEYLLPYFSSYAASFFKERRIQNVLWLNTITSRSYSWGHSQSGMSYEHMSGLNGYGATDVLNSGLFEPYVERQGHSCVSQHRKFDCVVTSSCLLCLHTLWLLSNNRKVTSGDHSCQLCGPPRPNHRSGTASIRYSVTCQLKCGVPRDAGSTSVIVLCLSKHL
jgi:hypothetical protein